jgi:hypothetical protein
MKITSQTENDRNLEIFEMSFSQKENLKQGIYKKGVYEKSIFLRSHESTKAKLKKLAD